ncbi:sugar phosphate isomerase/epimerase family protein [Mediterraneibacter agrestimuris]|uniref:sugar phosphate isomerase/epimerase family protein n=1 Tax=Mediterraneibacter agrestimuris TaxID=2941333 RepID=UPI00203BF07D|nr:sugar phosphate isomerase/epimerase family protein [Mediterraneibacter agrestimuris]
MEIGICAGMELAKDAAKAGYDYIELPLCTIAEMPDEEFKRAKTEFEKRGIPCRAFNILLPGGMKIFGQDVDKKALEAYAERACSRAHALHGKIIVFGSGGARRLPDDISMDEAWEQMKEVCRIFGNAAQKYGIKIVLEPLNRGETDLMHTVNEGIRMTEEISHSSVWLLADYYHMQKEKESVNVLVQAASYLKHCHIACGAERRFPAGKDLGQCREFIGMLQEIGYQGMLSVEGVTQHFAEDAKESILLLRELVSMNAGNKEEKN